MEQLKFVHQARTPKTLLLQVQAGTRPVQLLYQPVLIPATYNELETAVKGNILKHMRLHVTPTLIPQNGAPLVAEYPDRLLSPTLFPWFNTQEKIAQLPESATEMRDVFRQNFEPEFTVVQVTATVLSEPMEIVASKTPAVLAFARKYRVPLLVALSAVALAWMVSAYQGLPVGTVTPEEVVQQMTPEVKCPTETFVFPEDISGKVDELLDKTDEWEKRPECTRRHIKAFIDIVNRMTSEKLRSFLSD